MCTEFLAGQYFDRLSATLLVAQPDGGWKGASVNGEQGWYPGCVVKLGSLPLIAHVARERQGELPENFGALLDRAYIPSDNEPYGEVVDLITQRKNFSPESSTGPEFRAWLDNRFMFERYLEKGGLLRGQRFFHKTYPSNSSLNPVGAEAIALNTLGANRLRTNDLAELMVMLIEGKLEPDSTELFHHLLLRERRASSSVLGHSLPPGTIYYSKMGSGRETIGDVAYVTLPNGRTFVLSVFANARQGKYTDDRHFSDMIVVSPFVELLISCLDFYPDEVQVTLNCTDDGVQTTGNWELSKEHPLFSTLMSTASDVENSIEFVFNIKEAGMYEMELSYADFSGGCMNIPIEVMQTSPTGKTVYRGQINFSRPGGRWYYLDSALFESGEHKIRLKETNSACGKIGVSAIRLRKLNG